MNTESIASCAARNTPPCSEGVETLYRDHYRSLVVTAQRLLDTTHLAEEAVQEVFARIHARGFSASPGSEVAYLRVAVMNTARSMLRRRQTADRWRPQIPRTEAPQVDEAFLGREKAMQLRHHCERLPERQRQVIMLRYWHGLSVGETAERLLISQGSVKTHASRGCETLRGYLMAEAA